MNRSDFKALLRANVKTGRWVSGCYVVGGVTVSVMAIGLYIHRLKIDGIPYWQGATNNKTEKAFMAELDAGLNFLIGDSNHV